MRSFCGSGVYGVSNGNRLTASFSGVCGVCADPLNPRCYYIADRDMIRYFDESRDSVTDFMGRATGAGTAGCATDTRLFADLLSILITADGKTMWCSQTWCTFRRIDLSTGQIESVPADNEGEDGVVSLLVWDRSSDRKPESAFYCRCLRELAYDDERCISRFDLVTKEICGCAGSDSLYPDGMVCTPTTGLLILTEGLSPDLTLYDPHSGQLEVIGSVIEFWSQLALIESSRAVIAVSCSHMHAAAAMFSATKML